MNKDTKKKVAGGAAVATAAAGAVVAGAASALSQDNENVEAAAAGTPIAEGETIKEGQILPELVVEGTKPTLNGGELPEATVPGHAHTAHTQAQTAHSQAPTAEPQSAETNVVAQQGSFIEEENKQEETDEDDPQIPLDEEQEIPQYIDPNPGLAYNPKPYGSEERGDDPLINMNGNGTQPDDYQPNAYTGD